MPSGEFNDPYILLPGGELTLRGSHPSPSSMSGLLPHHFFSNQLLTQDSTLVPPGMLETSLNASTC